MALSRYTNPFSITKAVDLDDRQIEQLWVAIAKAGEDGLAAELDRPSSPMPTFILGAKGSGKTHLMRHQAFELQLLRHKYLQIPVREGIRRDGYVGVYARCSGLQSGRFSGKRQSEEVWDEVFSYYFELWVSHHLLKICRTLELGKAESDEEHFVQDVISLFDRPPGVEIRTLEHLIQEFEKQQKDLDFQVNNCILRGRLDIEITATRGKLIFGIPAVVAKRYKDMEKILVSYDIDEFENLTQRQQTHVNTLIRERAAPTTFRIGARSYGIRTHQTHSAGEENVRHSEFQEIHLDKEYRERKSQYKSFVNSLISKRLGGGDETNSSPKLNFEVENTDWDSEFWNNVCTTKKSPDRPHFKKLFRNLDKISSPQKTKEHIFESLACPQYPIIEKLNILLLYQAMFRRRELRTTADEIHDSFTSFLSSNDSHGKRYLQALQHYKDDLSAQILRENDKSQLYCSLDTFVSMSSGIPRALLTILRSIYEWSEFLGEVPNEGGRISITAQRKGVGDASNWYYHSMRKAGDDGRLIQAAIDRLAGLMRINRFADKPVEVEVSTFSVSEHDMNGEAQRILKLAESRAFIHRIPDGQRDKNSSDIISKFQLSPMLAPRWDLPLVRRGVLTLKPDEATSIFDESMRDEYMALTKSHSAKMTAPFNATTFGNEDQPGLFE